MFAFQLTIIFAGDAGDYHEHLDERGHYDNADHVDDRHFQVIVPKQGGVSPLFLVWTYVNTKTVLLCRTEQLSRDLGLISIWTLEQFYLQWEHNWASNRIMCCLATGVKSSLIKINKMFCCLHCSLFHRSFRATLFLFVPADFVNSLFCVWFPTWNVAFHLLSYCCCCCHVAVPQYATSTHKAVMWGPKETSSRVCASQ